MFKKNKQEIYVGVGILIVLVIIIAYWLQDNTSYTVVPVNQYSQSGQQGSKNVVSSKNVLPIYTIIVGGSTNTFELHAHDIAGLHTGPTGVAQQGLPLYESKIPGSSFAMSSNQETLILDSKNPYTVDIYGKSPSFINITVMVSKAGDSKPTIYVSPNNFQTVYGSKTTINLPLGNGVPVLQIDTNSDGVVDSQVTMKLQ